ncbi:MAG: DUF2298 domain-containing protein [Anaerolineales bacterium]|nr:DUF2298 domain-containing protein [Anaerolineales bacterium]
MGVDKSAHVGVRSQLRQGALWLIMVLVLLVGAYFRLVGIDWGENQYLHPDERFLIWVGADISPAGSFSEYFDTQNSSLNPHNRGHGFFVYGTLPLFMARYLVEWIYGHSGFEEMTRVGRPLSALADLMTVFVVYLVAARLFNKRVGVLASAFYALAVLPVQLSHFYKEDTFTNLFTFIAIYLAVEIYSARGGAHSAGNDSGERGDLGSLDLTGDSGGPGNRYKDFLKRIVASRDFYLSIGFGIALGCAVASKLNAVPVAFMLPTAFLLRWYASRRRGAGDPSSRQSILEIFTCLVVAALVSLVVFRVFQPYAFSGPGIFGVKPNPQWVANIREQRIQSTGDVDFPPALQWARRPVWFSGQNMILWGLGLPLGLLAWSGFLLAAWRMLKGDWQPFAVLWIWTGFYFGWQSLAFNPTMRYQLPVYPALVIFAAWLVVDLYQQARRGNNSDRPPRLSPPLKRGLVAFTGTVVLLLTLAWVFAFTRIYTRPITRVAATRWIYQNIPGPINLRLSTAQGSLTQPVPFPEGQIISSEQPFIMFFNALESGSLAEIHLPHVIDVAGNPGQKSLEVALAQEGLEELIEGKVLEADFLARNDARGDEYTIPIDPPVSIEEGRQYRLTMSLIAGNGEIGLKGAAPANESSWDDGLPLRMDGFDGYGGIYQSGLNFEMYWDDNTEKLGRFITTLNQADYIFISSNRQWGTTTRVPERYPLTGAYYRHLLGCPPEEDLIWCYNVAQVGSFQGDMGFDLVQVFTSYPSIGVFEINDQFAEEAFTVYDHPKVFIFQKRPDYNPYEVSAILSSVDLTQVIHVTPRQAGSYPANLLFPTDRWAGQQAGGTWSELFDTQALHNRYPAVGAVLWYLSLFLLGWAVYPLVRIAFRALPDHGYPLARIAGLLLFSYMVWFAGSLGVPFVRQTMIGLLGLLLIASIYVALRTRVSLVAEIKGRWRYYLGVESLFLVFFLLDLLIRIGNPDLWHPWKGGEKPMDFAYLNAVLKSTTFPPYDPWYAGGYLNYYYFGFVLVGVLVKLLGIVPAIAYNLIVPTLFALIAIGAYSLGWNLVHVKGDLNGRIRQWAGIAAGVGMALLGNLGILRMIVQGYQKVASPDGLVEGVGWLKQWVWTIQGFFKVLAGASLPYSLGDWYWIPSRVIPAPNEVEPITEFPFFTVLYADPHAHLFAMPIALLVLAFGLSILKSGWRWDRIPSYTLGFFFGGLAIGALRATNTWDYYPYLALGCAAVAYAFWTNYHGVGVESNIPKRLRHLLGKLPAGSQKAIMTGCGVILLAFLSAVLYLPYLQWYGLGYNKVDIWWGTHTPVSAYLAHWGVFLFFIISWMVWETRDWMASTPVSSLSKLTPYKGIIQGAALFLFLFILFLSFWLKVAIAWLVIPLAVWAGILLLRPNQSEPKRLVLFLVVAGLLLTLMVEIIVLRGDIGRMNTVFKFYLQVWTFLAISAAACLGWLLLNLAQWLPGWRRVWTTLAILLVTVAALYPLVGGLAKIKDRMVVNAPHSLDGMAFMAQAEYFEDWGRMDLNQDYQAICWMQENVLGSPVIVEANIRNLYRWGSRFSIYTGLPGVVGWEWHQQQQRALVPSNWVSDRITEIDLFYLTEDVQLATDFLRKYNVRYIILGQQERGRYPGPGLNKFAAANGILWQDVYHDRDTVIFEVLIQEP